MRWMTKSEQNGAILFIGWGGKYDLLAQGFHPYKSYFHTSVEVNSTCVN